MPHIVFNLIVIQATDVDRSCRFYSALGLDFTTEHHGSGPEHVACELEGVVFEIYPRRNVAIDATTRIGFSVASVDHAIAQLKLLDAEIVREAKDSPWGRRAVVADPDGYRIELSERGPA